MPFPRVEQCIVCEDARPEMGGKLTILGFYGLLPNVQLVVQDLTKPIDRLSFMLLCGGTEGGKFKVRPQLTSPHGESALMANLASDLDVVVPGNASRQVLVFNMAPVLFPGPGKYAFGLLVDSKEVYRQTFEVMQGTLAVSAV